MNKMVKNYRTREPENARTREGVQAFKVFGFEDFFQALACPPDCWRRLSVLSTIIVSLCLCVIVSLPAAQAQVDLETNTIEIESEVTLDDIQQMDDGPIEIETEIGQDDGSFMFEDDSFQIESEVVPSEEEVITDYEMDLGPLNEELIQAKQSVNESKSIREEDVLKINQSLRRAIEQNRRLQQEKKKLSEELGLIRGQTRMERTRRETLENQVRAYEAKIDEAVNAQSDFDETVTTLQTKIQERENVLLARINELQRQLEGPVQDERPTTVMDDQGNLIQVQQEGLDVINFLDELDAMQQQMKEDEARVHYNMGNIFFHQGKIDEAVAEYKKAIEIMPSDANAHFNLAFVAGDYLHEYKTAIQHYQQYLYLNPSADDAPLVQEKILEAQLYVRSWDEKDVDREVQDERPKRLYNW